MLTKISDIIYICQHSVACHPIYSMHVVHYYNSVSFCSLLFPNTTSQIGLTPWAAGVYFYADLPNTFRTKKTVLFSIMLNSNLIGRELTPAPPSFSFSTSEIAPHQRLRAPQQPLASMIKCTCSNFVALTSILSAC